MPRLTLIMRLTLDRRTYGGPTEQVVRGPNHFSPVSQVDSKRLNTCILCLAVAPTHICRKTL